MANIIIVLLVLAYPLTMEATRIYAIIKIKQRQKAGLLPDFKQIKELRDMFVERYFVNPLDLVLSVDAEKEAILSSEQLGELSLSIHDKNFEKAWEIVAEMLHWYYWNWIVFAASIAAFAIVLVFVLRFV